jgi:predicted nuclease of predicted toxin-antitoxin system
MNLSPEWVPLFRQSGLEALHWSDIGRATAADDEVLQWARENQAVVFTHDLDFGILLAQTESTGPSVIQVRTQDVTPGHLGNLVLAVFSAHGTALATGALITVDGARARVRIPPSDVSLARSARSATSPPSRKRVSGAC